MPWLLQTADAGGSLAKGAAVGQAISANRARRDAIRMQREQFAQELPLRQAASKADLLRAGAQAAEFVLKQNDQEASGLFGALVADIAGRQAWADPASEQSLWAFTERYPQVAEKDGFKAVLERMKVARDAAERTEAAQALIKQREASTKLAEARTTALTQDPDDFTQRAKALGLEPSGIDAQGRTTFARPRVTEETTVTPGGVTIKKGPSTVTTATQTRFEQAEANALQTASRARRLLPLLSPENVGPRGMLTRTAEAVAGTAIPGYKVGTAIEAVTVARQFKSGLIDMLKSDSNISVKEVDAIEGALPQPDKFITASNQEKVKLAATLEDVGQLSRNNAKLRGKPVSPIWLMPGEIDARLKAGEINEDEALKLLEGNMWIFVALIRQNAQAR